MTFLSQPTSMIEVMGAVIVILVLASLCTRWTR